LALAEYAAASVFRVLVSALSSAADRTFDGERAMEFLL
jgi:hypothetical protein